MRFWRGMAVVLVAAGLLLAAPARLGGAAPDPLLADTDPHYHVLRAERILRGAPGAPWRDPALDWPRGAAVPWPPLFDLALAGAARASGAETRGEIARAAAVVPLLLGLLLLLAAGLLGRAVAGDAAGLGAAALLALLPGATQYALLGRVDQHVAELLLASAIALAFLHGAREDRRGPAAPLLLGAAIALAFWTWMGSTVALLAPAATVAAARLLGADALARRAGTALAGGAAAGAVLLAGSVAALGPPGALLSTSVLGVGGLHVAIVAGLAAFAAAVAWRARPGRGEGAPTWLRALEVVAALALPAALLLGIWSGLREGVARGLVALGAANPWYAEIREFRPLLGSGLRPVWAELSDAISALGLAPLVALLAVPALRARWREAPAERAPLLFLAVWGSLSLALALARFRFLGYLAVPCAVAAAAGALWLGRAVAGRLARPGLGPGLAALVLLAAAAPALPTLAAHASGEVRVSGGWVEAAAALRELPPSDPERPGVAGPWSLGHLVQYHADRPVFATPFGTEAGPAALQDWARFLFAGDEDGAVAPLLARRVSHVLVGNPSHEWVGLRGFAPPGALAPLTVDRSVWRGETVEPTPALEYLVAARLYFGDGAAGTGGPALERFRLVWEGPSTAPPHPLLEERLQIWELLPAAELTVEGAPPGAVALVTVDVQTSARRRFRWTSARTVGPGGTATFRVPYATGRNGAALASAAEVRAGDRRAVVVVPPEGPALGTALRVSLAPLARGR